MAVIYVVGVIMCLALVLILIWTAKYLIAMRDYGRTSNELPHCRPVSTIGQQSKELTGYLQSSDDRLKELEASVGPIIDEFDRASDLDQHQFRTLMLERLLAIAGSGDLRSTVRSSRDARLRTQLILEALDNLDPDVHAYAKEFLASVFDATDQRPILGKAGQMSTSMSPATEWRHEYLCIAASFWRNVDRPASRSSQRSKKTDSTESGWDGNYALAPPVAS